MTREYFRRRNFALTQQNVAIGAVKRKIGSFEIARNGFSRGRNALKLSENDCNDSDSFKSALSAHLNVSPRGLSIVDEAGLYYNIPIKQARDQRFSSILKRARAWAENSAHEITT